jgi:Ser/Thr protein kinase RdoA (MazF antagonist)
MEQRILDLYNDAILQEVMHRYGIADSQIRLRKAFENFIYEFERDGHAFILRISHSLRRSEALIEGEVDWINYLADGGVSVAKAVRSTRGKLVEAVEDGQGGEFLVTAFVKVQGIPPWDYGWSPTLYQTYGRLLGEIHALSSRYQPADLAWKRPAWDDPLNEFVDRYLPASEVAPKQKHHALRDHLHKLPKAPATYGMIHQDAHGSNMLVDSAGAITLFDFDDCVYSWFVNDIAIVLFYIAQDADDMPAFTQEFMSHFLTGYRQAYVLDPQWLREIPNFLKLRELELYAVVHRDFDVNNIDHPWVARFMRDRKAKIEQDAPFIDFDFESLAQFC